MQGQDTPNIRVLQQTHSRALSNNHRCLQSAACMEQKEVRQQLTIKQSIHDKDSRNHKNGQAKIKSQTESKAKEQNWGFRTSFKDGQQRGWPNVQREIVPKRGQKWPPRESVFFALREKYHVSFRWNPRGADKTAEAPKLIPWGTKINPCKV